MIWYGWAVVAFFSIASHGYCTAVDLSRFLYGSNVKNGLEETEKKDDVPEMDVFRLPANVMPVSYDLEVATDFVNMTYFGRVHIVIQASVTTCQIVLNAKDLLVAEVEIFDQKLNKALTVVDRYLVEMNEQLVIVLNDTVTCLIGSRTYVVNITFGAPFRNDTVGFYRSSYKENDVTKYDSWILRYFYIS